MVQVMRTDLRAGDLITVMRTRPRLNGERQHPIWEYSGNCNARWGKGRECCCKGADIERYDDQMVVDEIIWWGDNSVEAHGYCISDGAKWHTMTVPPSGDACF